MSPHPIPPNPQQTPEERAEDLAFYRATLHGMIHAGTGLANTLELRAVNATMDGTNAAIDAATSYERVSRAVRRSIMLAIKLSDPTPATTAPAQTPSTPEPRPTTPERLDHDRPESPTPELSDDPTLDLNEDLTDDLNGDLPDDLDDDLDEDLDDDRINELRPIEDQLAAIRRDLGLNLSPLGKASGATGQDSTRPLTPRNAREEQAQTQPTPTNPTPTPQQKPPSALARLLLENQDRARKPPS